jgi:uncharacterized protein (DUF427 family)
MTSGHTITITPVSRHVEIALAGTKLAQSDEVVVLEETGLPPRYYLSRGDVRTELLVPSDSTTTCPFKGDASYWSVELDGRAYADIVWSYEDPIPSATGIAGLMCFYNERVDFTIDGERVPRAETPQASNDRCG